MGATGFQRRRRMMAQQKAEQEAKELEEQQLQQDPPADEKEPDGQPDQEPKTVDEMSVEELRAALDQLEIVYPHNTGEKKLRERLRDATK